MAADLKILPPTDHQTATAQMPQQSNPSYTRQWMWNTTRSQEDDDSWEVRAFAEDTSNVMGTTWPPRSYTCTFCRREFRSAQALGGHMNVHRKDRARLRQSPPKSITDPALSPASPSTLIFPPQEFVTNGGICLLYPIPNPNGVFSSASMPSSIESPTATLMSISPYTMNSLMSTYSSTNFPMEISSDKVEATVMFIDKKSESTKEDNNDKRSEGELDLELRLGPKSFL